MTNALIAILIGVACAFCIWSFVLVLQSEPKPHTDEEVAQIDARLRAELGKCDSDGVGVVGVSEVSKISVLPFPRMLPGFQISPHRLGGIAGIIGACLVLFSLLWCLFVPRTISVNTQWSNSPSPATSEPFRIVLQNEDGSFKEIDIIEPSDGKTKKPNKP
jgi:hypothetical protein